jgi:TonB family protein
MRVRNIVICIALAPLVLGSAQPVRLEPASPWNVDYAANSCRLFRDFGSAATLTKFALESASPGEMDMLIVGKPLRTSASTVAARLLPVGSKTFDGMVVKAAGTGDPAVLWSNIPMLPDATLAEIEREREQRRRNPGVRPPPMPVAVQAARRAQQQQFANAVTALEIQISRRSTVVLEMESFGKAMAAFNKCSRDSLKDWGVDPDLDDKIVRPPWAINPTRWLGSDDYPADMVKNGKQSDVTLRLLVDAAGKVTKCTSLSHFEDEEFNRISCARVSQRARFEPAELADGTKVPSYYTFRIKFRIG